MGALALFPLGSIPVVRNFTISSSFHLPARPLPVMSGDTSAQSFSFISFLGLMGRELTPCSTCLRSGCPLSSCGVWQSVQRATAVTRYSPVLTASLSLSAPRAGRCPEGESHNPAASTAPAQTLSQA
jgi:hypothetical protein